MMHFYKIQGFYVNISQLDLLNFSISNYRTPKFITFEIQETKSHRKLYPSERKSLESQGVECKKDTYIIQTMHGFALQTVRGAFTWSIRRSLSNAHRQAEIHSTNFRLMRREALFSQLTQEKAELECFLSAFCEYAFFDHYSIWTYNKLTKTFTLVCASFSPPNEYIHESDNTTLNEFLNSDIHFIERPVEKNESERLPKIAVESLVRTKLNLGDENETTILSLYSSRKNFYLQSGTRSNMKAIVGLKYSATVRATESSLHNITQYILESRSLAIDEFFSQLTVLCRDQLWCEACSVLIRETGTDEFKVVACADTERNGESVNISYLLSEKSLTMEVAEKTDQAGHSDESLWIEYDLAKSGYNSNKFNEATNIPGKNWMCFPIVYDRKTFAIVRFKNKYRLSNTHDRIALAPRPIDCNILLSIQSQITNYIRMKLDFTDLQLKTQSYKNSLRVLGHEIRAPITTISANPNHIRTILEPILPNDKNTQKLLAQLKDITVLGERLRFVSRAYDVETMKSKKRIKSHNLLNTIVFPILNLTQPYHEKQHNVEFVFDQALMFTMVDADQDLSNVVLNAIVDNAAKYIRHNGSRVIKIYAAIDRKKNILNLIIENDGIPISPDENESIFLDTRRGREPERLGIDGTGTGLYLARELMREQGGDVTLTVDGSSIKFNIHFVISRAKQ